MDGSGSTTIERLKNHTRHNGENGVHYFPGCFYSINFILAGNEDIQKAYLSSKFGQITLLTSELVALECLQNRFLHFLSVATDPIIFKLPDYKVMHNNYLG